MKYARIVPFALLTAVATGLSACGGKSQAVGTVGSIIVIATDSLWADIGERVMTALEPSIFTVRDERTFEVTHVAPSDPNWSEMRNFRQVLAIGAPDDAWVQPILDEAGAQAGAGSIVQTDDVWARNQFATAMVLPSSDASDAALEHLPRLAATIDSTFRAYAMQRMYMSGVDSALADTLRQTGGFTLLLPQVYEQTKSGPDVWLFQNATQIGGDLVRSILVTWREGTDPVDPVAWRDSIASTEYRPPQRTDRESIRVSPVPSSDQVVAEVQGVWVGTDPSWPTGGPFITRVVSCPAQNRTYLIDAWLFAPSRAKYEYMIQLQTILGTFDCA